MKNNPWLLPDGIEEILPDEAWHLEGLRRRLLDVFSSWGYQLVIPPLIEYLDSLLTGTGHDLDLQTFKVTDQLTGRMMGIRADMTPQIARIDACHLHSTQPSRLCYIGSVLRTRIDGFGSNRSPMQVGAELYGHEGTASDVEILCLMLKTLETVGISNICLDLGHVSIYRSLTRAAGLQLWQEIALFEMLQRKALPEIELFLQASGVSTLYQRMLEALVYLNGDIRILKEARRLMVAADSDVHGAIDYLEDVAMIICKRSPGLNVHIDLAELRGYHYKTGIVFAAFTTGQGQEIARGGRYDGIAEIFGNPRPATGFSSDLKILARLMTPVNMIPKAIYAPNVEDHALQETITYLRAQGERVICELSGQHGSLEALGCDRKLVKHGKDWHIEII